MELMEIKALAQASHDCDNFARRLTSFIKGLEDYGFGLEFKSASVRNAIIDMGHHAGLDRHQQQMARDLRTLSRKWSRQLREDLKKTANKKEKKNGNTPSS